MPRALITKPDLILYDSPTGGLDPSPRRLSSIWSSNSVTSRAPPSLVITHRLQDAFRLATHRFNQQTNEVEPLPNNGIDDSTGFW